METLKNLLPLRLEYMFQHQQHQILIRANGLDIYEVGLEKLLVDVSHYHMIKNGIVRFMKKSKTKSFYQIYSLHLEINYHLI